MAERKSPRLRRADLKSRSINLVLLTIVWLLLVGDVTPVTVVGGLVISFLVAMVFPLPAIRWAGWIHPIGLIRLLVSLIFDLAKASVELALFAFDFRRQPKSGIVAERLSSDGDLYQVGTGAIMSIVPGSVVVDARRRTRTLYMHIFDMSSTTPDEQRRLGLKAELRILRAFGTRDEIRHAEAVLRGEAEPQAPSIAEILHEEGR